MADSLKNILTRRNTPKPEDFVRYLNHALKGDEMHQFEEAVSSDAMTAEALEGLEKAKHDMVPVNSTLEELEFSIENKVEEKSFNIEIDKKVWYVAAGIVGLAVVIYLITLIDFGSMIPEDQVAEKTEEPKKEEVTAKSIPEEKDAIADTLVADTLVSSLDSLATDSLTDFQRDSVMRADSVAKALARERYLARKEQREKEIRKKEIADSIEKVRLLAAADSEANDIPTKPVFDPSSFNAYSYVSQMESSIKSEVEVIKTQANQAYEEESSKGFLGKNKDKMSRQKAKAERLEEGISLYESKKYNDAASKLYQGSSLAEKKLAAVAEAKAGNYNNAFRSANSILSSTPSDPQMKMIKAISLIKTNRLNEAKTVLKELQNTGGSYGRSAKEILDKM